MADIDVVAAFIASVVAFVASGAYYGALGSRLAEVSPSAAAVPTPPWTYAVELARTLVVVLVVAGLVSHADLDAFAEGVLLGLALWVGFPLMLWAGAMLHERTAWPVAAIHAGDWLVKLVIVAVILSVMA